MNPVPMQNPNRLFLLVGALAYAWSTAGPVAADGLIFKLPADGTAVTYRMDMDSDDGKMTGTLTVSSVGTTNENDEASRWIELKMAMTRNEREQIVRAKLLIPEKRLAKGEAGFANAIRGYQKQGQRDVEAIDVKNPRNVGPLPAFFSGPLKNQKDLDAAEVDSGIGKLKCRGVSGDVTIRDGSQDVTIAMEHRLHQQAPFGVLQSTMTFGVSSDGQPREGATVRLILDKVGKGAKSELPDSN